jgi:positive regulator of sigma E activity
MEAEVQVMPNALIRSCALVFSWSLVLLPVAAVVGDWALFAAAGAACLMTAAVLVLGYVRVQASSGGGRTGRRPSVVALSQYRVQPSRAVARLSR